MAKTGPKPKPNRLKKLQGTYRKDRDGVGGPELPAAKVRMPRGLSEGAKKFWRRVAPKCIELGVLTELDIPAFVLMAEHYATAQQAKAILRNEGLTTMDSSGNTHKHPMCQVLRDNSTSYRLLANEFGLTPSSRDRLGLVAPEPLDELEKLLFGRGAKVK